MRWFTKLWGRVTGREPEVSALLAADGVARRIARCAALLPEAPRGAVRETVRVFARWVFDLPASEAHHDSGPFGLFNHSLAASENAVRIALADGMAAPVILAAWVFGLFHDVAKVAWLRVSAPGDAVWNPYLEPLVAFYDRHGRTRCAWAWVPGRARDGMQWPTPMLMGRVVPIATVGAIGGVILTDVLERRTSEGERVVKLVGAAEREAVATSLALGKRTA